MTPKMTQFASLVRAESRVRVGLRVRVGFRVRVGHMVRALRKHKRHEFGYALVKDVHFFLLKKKDSTLI